MAIISHDELRELVKLMRELNVRKLSTASTEIELDHQDLSFTLLDQPDSEENTVIDNSKCQHPGCVKDGGWKYMPEYCRDHGRQMIGNNA